MIQKALWHVCKNDILFWLNVFAWIFEPRPTKQAALGVKTPHIPFITWPYQDDYIVNDLCDAIDNGYDRLTEKARDMGATWMAIAVFLYYWLFRGAGNDFLLGSRKQEYVDRKGNMSTLFPKMRYILKRLPFWMIPIGYHTRIHDNFMRLENPETGSMIFGESNNENFGTSGRVKAALLDEMAKWLGTDQAAWQSLSDVTDCKLALSSAKGKVNHFYKLRSGTAGKIIVSRLEWRLHPLKDEVWYAAQKLRRTEEDLAAEVDIDYSASVTDRAFPRFLHRIHCDERVFYNKNAPIHLMCDFNITPMSWVMSHESSGVDYFFNEHVSMVDTTTEAHMSSWIKKYKDHVNKTLIVWGDGTGSSRSVHSLKSNYAIIKKMAQDAGWAVVVMAKKSNGPVILRLNATNKRFYDYEHDGKSWVKIDPINCPNLITSFEQTQRKDDGVDKSTNIEHAAEAAGYKFVVKYPIEAFDDSADFYAR